jgi:branched-chain amino acid transport system permease protein
MGIAGIPKPNFFGITINGTSYLVLVILIALISYLLIKRIVNSPFGRVLKAIREDELAIKSLGKNTNSYKTIALAISAFFAGIAGSLYAHYTSFIDPSAFSIVESILIVSMIVVGGLGTMMGPIIGVFALFFLLEIIKFFPIPSSLIGAIRQMIYSVVLIAVLVKMPRGLMGNKKGEIK